IGAKPSTSILKSKGRGVWVPAFAGTTLRLQRRQHRIADIGGAVLATEFHWLDALRIGLVDGALDPLAGLSRRLQTMLVGEPVEHHRRRQDHPGWIRLALPHDVGRGAVTGLE